MRHTGKKPGKKRVLAWGGIYLVLLLWAVGTAVSQWGMPAVVAMEQPDGGTQQPLDGRSQEASRGSPVAITVPVNLVRFPLGESPEYAVVVEKSTQQLFLFAYDGTMREVERMQCSTGKTLGPKTKSGDQKTPEGIYFFTKNVPGKFLSARYGSRALPIDYPNYLDRLNARTGYAIWLHGIDKPLKPRNSNGCIVLQNNDIDRLAGYISLGHTPLVIVQTITPGDPAERGAAAEIALDFLGRWKRAMEHDSVMAVTGLHGGNGSAPLEWWPEWEKARQLVHDGGGRLSLDLRRLAIIKHESMYVIRMELRVNAGHRQWTAGTSRMYLQSVGDSMQIIGQTFLGQPAGHQMNRWPHPLAAVSRQMLQSF